MKIYVREDGLILAGKAWEVRAKLKEAMKRYTYVSEWSQAVHRTHVRTASPTARKNAGSSLYSLPIVRIGKEES
ncbi:Z-ring formation inhibitor MciZ [Bacillus solitudinis]|uniref:Z-ring formation inhibitor MciZ n=1 Tax=Bacillus solitudinis TaxID=2014074 RepID=UPI000C235346|nr:Z-ring formation inhibitor MciZ [Bacillus solitudinis]